MIDSCNESLAVDGLAPLCLSRRSGTLPKPFHELLDMHSHSIAVCGADEQYLTEIGVPRPTPAIQYNVGITGSVTNIACSQREASQLCLIWKTLRDMCSAYLVLDWSQN